MAGKTQYTTNGKGCRFHDNCLECPKETCIYDNGGLTYDETINSIVAKREKAKQLSSQGLSIKEICQFTGATKKAVEHYLYKQEQGA